MLSGRHTSGNRLQLRYLCTGQTPECCSQSHTAAEPRQLQRPFDLGTGSVGWPAVAWGGHLCLFQLECLQTDKALAVVIARLAVPLALRVMEWKLQSAVQVPNHCAL